MKKILCIAASLFIVFNLSSCKKEKSAQKRASGKNFIEETHSSTPLKLKKINEDTKTYLENKNIVVFLGYGYNDEETVLKISETLKKNFGVENEEQPGLVNIFVFPRDFMRGSNERISMLTDKIEEKQLAGMVILGAPEGMHSVLSKLQDKEEDGVLKYPVFSMFSQDDVLGTESTADLVLDYAHKTNVIESEMTDFIPDFDANDLVNSSVQMMTTLRGPLETGSSLITYARKLFNDKRKVSHYIDSETGLQSINHFTFD